MWTVLAHYLPMLRLAFYRFVKDEYNDGDGGDDDVMVMMMVMVVMMIVIIIADVWDNKLLVRKCGNYLWKWLIIKLFGGQWMKMFIRRPFNAMIDVVSR